VRKRQCLLDVETLKELNVTCAEIGGVGERPGVDTTPRELRAGLQASEERARALLALSPDGISVVDQTGRILTCNEQFARIHGYEHSREIIGRYAAEFMTPEAYTRVFSEIAAAFAAGESVVRGIEIAAFKRDGATVTAEYSVAQVPWPDAQTGVAFISNIRDITKRKALLVELDQHRTHLEDLLHERTRELEAEIAERAAVQAALQRSAANLVEAERIAHVGSWERDVLTGEVWWSDEIYRIFGYDRRDPQAPTEGFWERLHPDDRDAVEAAYAHSLETGESFDSIHRILLPSGEPRLVRTLAEIGPDDQGRGVHLHGTVQDITEQERIKQALAQRVKELSSLQALSAVTNLRLSLDETVRLALEKIVTLAGLDMAKLFLLRENRLYQAGGRLGELVTGTQSQIFDLGECLCGLAVRDGRTVYAEDIENDERCSRPYCLVQGLRSVVALPLHNGGAIIGALVLGSVTRNAFADSLTFLETAAEQIAVGLHNALLLQEVQDRAAGLEETVAERTHELQTERDRTQAILETVGESVVVTDLDGQVLFLNPATVTLTGFSRNELLGRPLWSEWSAQTRAHTWPEAQQALRSGQAWQGEITGHRKSGRIYIAELVGTPLYDEHAAPLPTGAVWVQRDITALKEVGRLKDQFVSNVSHELRTPISIIALSSDNLQAFYDRLDEGQRRQMLRDIHGQVHVLSELVEDILVLSQIDSDRLPARQNQINLAPLVRDEAERQLPRAEERSQRFSITTGTSVVVLGSEVQLRRVTRSLLDNAIKYTPAGGRITCTCEIRDVARAAAPEGDTRLPGSWAVIEITDTGIGIPSEALPLLFERFFRVNAEGAVPGTGLGLAIARELVLLHGGWIDVASSPDRGSTFTVYLPLTERELGDR
jgi:PAS domain S-box-containing protein